MSPMRTQRTKRGAERAEEPVEPVEATTTPPADHGATDALLAAIEDVLDPVTTEEVQAKPAWEVFAFADFAKGAEGFEMQFLPTPRTEDEQEILYEAYAEAWFRREREQRPDDLPWEDIAKLPPPGPGGTTVEFIEPQEIDWAYAEPGDDPDVIVAAVPYRTRVIHVTRAMWEEANRGLIVYDRIRSSGDDGLCRRCGWPRAGPGRFPCGDGTRPPVGMYMPPVMDPTAFVNISNC